MVASDHLLQPMVDGQ